ncbi:LIM and SH3 domain protein Lasp isoform X2 [Oratosquilla oratoria]|uniref:LIM and SH3 domain protein Lasp isoform X2 n=1 Tax=Oratosquilla oratoria TaxID=337810 RepID=UPI003F77774D
MSKRCARCEKTVYPLEELKCLDKIWHKGCFKCQECAMTLSMKTYKGFNKLPYCEAHIPKAKATTVAETPELKRLAENTKIQSNVQYHADFEKNKAKFTQVADDPETIRIKNTTKIISNVAYHGELERKAEMERKRDYEEDGKTEILWDDAPPQGISSSNSLGSVHANPSHTSVPSYPPNPSHTYSEYGSTAADHVQHAPHKTRSQGRHHPRHSSSTRNNNDLDPHQHRRNYDSRKSPPQHVPEHKHSHPSPPPSHRSHSQKGKHQPQQQQHHPPAPPCPYPDYPGYPDQRPLHSHDTTNNSYGAACPNTSTNIQYATAAAPREDSRRHPQPAATAAPQPPPSTGAPPPSSGHMPPPQQQQQPPPQHHHHHQNATAYPPQQHHYQMPLQQQQPPPTSSAYHHLHHQHPHPHQPSQQNLYHDANHNSPYSSRTSQTVIYTSQTGPVQQQPGRRVGSIADYDPINDQYGSISTQPNQHKYPGGGYRQEMTYQVQRNNLYGDANNTAPTGPPAAAPTGPSAPQKVNAPPTQLGRCYRAMYDYEAADTDEITFQDGDYIINCTAIDEGWMTGTVQRTGQTGMLPANYVERVN